METINKNSLQRKSVSICQQFNLNTNELIIQNLMEKTIYRRLYNIVCFQTNNDQKDTSYRKNLIKQLYFLLKIVPIMRIDLQDKFLENLESWYNMNDHKKTELASGGLKNLINQYVKQPSDHSQFVKERPKSGVTWNKNVHPFLRPYTAKKTYKPQFKRPQSSNYGQNSIKNGKSANLSTKLDSCEQLTVRQFTSSIQQQWQISQDFLQKHRTVHPQSQPIYQQLYNILKKVYRGELQGFPKQSQTQMLFNFDKEDFFENIIHQQQKPYQQSKKIQIQEVQEVVNDFQRVSQESIKQSQVSSSEIGSQNKLYRADQNKKNIQQNELKSQQFHFFKPQSKNQQLLLKKVNNKYTHFTNNKLVVSAKDDQEIVRKYVNYTRAKSAIKRQLNRKSQTKRILSAKGSRSNTRIFLQEKQKRPLFQDKTNLLQRKNSLDKIRTYDFSQIPDNSQKKQNFPLPKYNKRKFLNEIYEKQINKYKKSNGCISTAEIKQIRKFPLTKFDNFLSQERIDPLSQYYKEKHNQQALDQIQKIKMKINGKNSVSTDALMKALYIDTSTCSINNDFPSVQNAWAGKDLCYGLLSNGTKKKLKKKHRKLKKTK